jgi:hypothetical protein
MGWLKLLNVPGGDMRRSRASLTAFFKHRIQNVANSFLQTTQQQSSALSATDADFDRVCTIVPGAQKQR